MNAIAKRSCGECSACCYTHGVKELNKDNFIQCQYTRGGGGCGIYGIHPKSCRVYSCSWLDGVVGAPEDRPDKLGLVIGVQRWQYRLGDPEVTLVFEAWPGAFDTERGQLFAHTQMQQGAVLCVMSKEKLPRFSYYLYRLSTTEAYGLRLEEKGYLVYWREPQD